MLQTQRWDTAFSGPLYFHDLRERQLAGGGVILAVHAAVKQSYGEDALEAQLAAYDLALRYRTAYLTVQQLGGALSTRR